MLELIRLLKNRDSESYKFFEGLLTQFTEGKELDEAKQKLLSCYAITQYADFTAEEEELLSRVIEANSRGESEESTDGRLRGVVTKPMLLSLRCCAAQEFESAESQRPETPQRRRETILLSIGMS